MNYDCKMDLRPRNRAAATFLPPALIEEAAWDILLALHSDDGRNMSLDKLASIVSTPRPGLYQWLALLEHENMITEARHEFEHEPRAVLTVFGRKLLDRYICATGDLRIGALD